jgi:zinc transport system permease protein
MGPGRNLDLMSYLFGSINTISSQDLIWISILSLVAGGLLLAFFKEFFLVSLDESLAQVSGLQPKRYNYLLILIASLIVALFMRILGVLLIGALMVVPVLAAMNLKKGFRGTLFWSVFFALFSVFGGLSLSLHFDIAAGGAIVLSAVGIYLISLSFKAP